MKAKRLHKRIILSKFILDSLLNFLTPKNLLIIYLSQKLDIYIYINTKLLNIKNIKEILILLRVIELHNNKWKY